MKLLGCVQLVCPGVNVGLPCETPPGPSSDCFAVASSAAAAAAAAVAAAAVAVAAAACVFCLSPVFGMTQLPGDGLCTSAVVNSRHLGSTLFTRPPALIRVVAVAT